ncbi:hypothetical protein F5Y00DRAFT_244861 [Daldinia vernicosa]|uniref:uncharacterized protein n=1 Tax=Daldinia vernicosa TaxID=114800 RepID=UPI0020089986|nr:uncharacterized protein F5Y00DRAFT_244861 [Daldinia vernicosa]KAI0846081.1 hypothetical protein F5Y00DRAFT_244861 [Daldinia vernicosa]
METMDMDSIDTSSLSSAPPSSPPQLPQDHPLYDKSTAAPPLTSELSELSELSDLPDATPNVSDSEEEEESDTDPTQPCDAMSAKIAADTQSFWRRKRRRGHTFERFMEGWLLGRSADNKLSGRRLHQMVRVLKTPKVRERLGKAGIRVQFAGEEEDKEEAKDIVPDLRKELSALVLQPAFSKFEPKSFNKPGDTPCAVKDVYNEDRINSAIQSSRTEIQVTAPKLHAFLTAILANKRAGQKSYREAKIDTAISNEARAYLIVTLFLGAYAPRRSDFLPLSMGIYLYSHKTPIRVIDTLARFGICTRYKATMKRLGQKPEASGDADNVSAAGSGAEERQPVEL